MTTELGRVTSVVPAPEEKRVYVSVKVSPGEYYEEIPYATGMTGLWMVPKEGDMLEVHEVGYETYVARTPHNPFPFTMPDMGEGDFVLRLNEDTELTFQKQADDTFDLSIETDGDISVKATDAVTVEAPSVKLGGETGTKLVARKGDTVEVSDPVSGTLNGTITSGSNTTEST